MSALGALSRPEALTVKNEEQLPKPNEVGGHIIKIEDFALAVSDDSPGNSRRHQAMGAALPRWLQIKKA